MAVCSTPLDGTKASYIREIRTSWFHLRHHQTRGAGAAARERTTFTNTGYSLDLVYPPRDRYRYVFRDMSRFFSALRGTISRRMSSQPSRSPVSSLVISRNPAKEPSQEYEPGGYHPVQVGDSFHQRYQVISQLGWGQHSTVWLVQDLQSVFSQLWRLIFRTHH